MHVPRLVELCAKLVIALRERELAHFPHAINSRSSLLLPLEHENRPSVAGSSYVVTYAAINKNIEETRNKWKRLLGCEQEVNNAERYNPKSLFLLIDACYRAWYER